MAVLIALGVVVGVVLLLVLWVIGLYNGLVVLRNRYKNAYAQIDVQLKRRYDLIPNLVETAKGYLKHERETLEAVIAITGSKNATAATVSHADFLRAASCCARKSISELHLRSRALGLGLRRLEQ